MRLVFEEYGLLVVSIVIGAVFLFFFARLINTGTGLGNIYNRAVAFGGSSIISYMLGNARLDSDGFIDMDISGVRSSSQKLYSFAGRYDFKSFNTPKFVIGEPVADKNYDIIKLGEDGVIIGGNWVMTYDCWLSQARLSSADGLPILVVVSEYTPITSTSAGASSDGSMYYMSASGEFVKYLGGDVVGDSGTRQDGVVLYSMQDTYDEFGNKVVEDGHVKQTMQVCYTEGKHYYLEDSTSEGVEIDYDIAKKYKVIYRMEKGKIKSERSSVFVNQTRELGTSDDQIKDLFNQLYKKVESEDS